MLRVRDPKAEFQYFYESLIDVFQTQDETLWGYSVWHGVEEAFYRFTKKPYYIYPEQALRGAKLHALVNLVERSRQLHCLTFHPTDRVFTQSETAIAQFGNAQDMALKDFYPNPQDRIDLIQAVRATGKNEAHLEVQNLDGLHFSGKVMVEPIQLDKDTHLLLELFLPDQVLQVAH